MLIGTVDRDDSLLTGIGATITFPKAGRLGCFANDVRTCFNNRGSVMLTVDLA